MTQILRYLTVLAAAALLGSAPSEAADMESPDDVSIEIDLQRARENAKAARSLLIDLRSKHDLAKWEYTKQIRIAPYEIPHSHPVLTLNGRNAVGENRDEDAFLAVYLHEQMHWALYLHRETETERAIQRLKEAYPAAHAGLPATAANEQSTYLHLVVNWLEISAVAEFIGRERAETAALKAPVYTSIYKTVIADDDRIQAILTSSGILPLPVAGDERGSGE